MSQEIFLERVRHSTEHPRVMFQFSSSAQVSFALHLLKSLVLVNGGALIAAPAFASLASASSSEVADGVGASAVWWCIGLLLAMLAGLIAYLVQERVTAQWDTHERIHMRHFAAEVEQSNNGADTADAFAVAENHPEVVELRARLKKIWQIATILQVVAILIGVGSVSCFGIGSVFFLDTIVPGSSPI